MPKERKVWSHELKLQIIKEVEEHGFEVTQRKHGFYPSMYYKWLKDYKASGEDGLKRKPRNQEEAPSKDVQQLKEKVELLERLLARATLQLALRDEVIKKKYPSLAQNLSFE
jgi:transposase-like protein